MLRRDSSTIVRGDHSDHHPDASGRPTRICLLRAPDRRFAVVDAAANEELTLVLVGGDACPAVGAQALRPDHAGAQFYWDTGRLSPFVGTPTASHASSTASCSCGP